MTQSPERAFFIKQVYASNVQFNIQTPASKVSEKWEPTADFSMEVSDTKIDNSTHSVDLNVKASVKIADKGIFEVSVKQTGEFGINGYDDEQLDRLLKSFCPNILFPYLRQLVTQMTTQAGYPPLNLSPVDFESRYQEMLKEKKSN